MSSRRQRERLRLERMAFDEEVEKARNDREKNELVENVSKMTKAELIKYAEYNGIEINKTAKKAEITADVLEIVKKK